MDASKKEIAEKLVNSNTLGLKEMAGTIMSELEKNQKVKEVVVRVRVVRLPKGQKNNNINKQTKCKAKVSTLSYKFNVNQKNLHKLLLKRRQQLRPSSKSNAINVSNGGMTTSTNSASSGDYASRKPSNDAVLFGRMQDISMNNEPNLSNSHSAAHFSLATNSPLSTTAYSAFSSPSISAGTSYFASNMSTSYQVGPHENSPSGSARLQQKLQCPIISSANYTHDYERQNYFEDPLPNSSLFGGDSRSGPSSPFACDLARTDRSILPPSNSSSDFLWTPSAAECNQNPYSSYAASHDTTGLYSNTYQGSSFDFYSQQQQEEFMKLTRKEPPPNSKRQM